jgi:hypothetical protein
MQGEDSNFQKSVCNEKQVMQQFVAAHGFHSEIKQGHSLFKALCYTAELSFKDLLSFFC